MSRIVQLIVRAVIGISFLLITHCGKATEPTENIPRNTDPARCTTVDIGDATDFIQQPNIIDDRMVRASGLTNPQALVWRDDASGKTFYLARIMGTERKLFFLKQVPDDAPPPGVASRFEGRLVRWNHLPPEQAKHMAVGLKSQYNIDVNMKEAFVIVQGQRPEGCPP